MALECPAPGSAAAASARRVACVHHGVDLDHRCDVARCRFVVSPERLKHCGRPARVAVCTTGLHVHWCGAGVCKLAAEEARHSDGPWVCPISKLEVTGQSEVYCPQRIRGRGGNPDKFAHTMVHQRRRASQRKSRSSETRRFVHMLLASKESRALIESAATRRERMVSAVVARAGRTFMSQMAAARQASPRANLPPVTPTMISGLAKSIDSFLDKVRPQLSVCKGNASQVAAIVGFLATGMIAENVVVFPKLSWVSQRLPAAADLGKLPGFQCRPVSISARHIKAAVFGANGRPIATLLFRCPPLICNQRHVGLPSRAAGAAHVASFGSARLDDAGAAPA